MEKLAVLYLLLILISGCVTDDSNDFGGDGGLPQSNVSSYDESIVNFNGDTQENLLKNGSFESGSDEWVICGNTSIKEGNAKDGEKYLELGTEGECELYQHPYNSINANAYIPLNIDSTPDMVYISFYAKTSKPMDMLNAPFSISLLGNTNIYTNDFTFRAVTFENILSDVIEEGWTKIKFSIEKNKIVEYLGNLVSKWLYIEVTSSENIKIAFDDIKVTFKEEVTQPSPMPDALKNYSGNSHILMVNRDKNVVATVRPNGQSLVNYDNISTELISSAPYWFANNQISLAKKTFNPSGTNTDATVVPASQSELYFIDLMSGTENLIYETFGSPGRYEFNGAPNNIMATDVEIYRTAWDSKTTLGALTVCSRNRNGIGFVSDDVCKIYIVNEKGELLNDEIFGFDAKWSSTGKLAYVWQNVLYVAEVNGNNVSTTAVYESKAGIENVVDWSPDGSSVVLLERGGDVINFNGELEWAFAIKVLNLNASNKKEIVLRSWCS